MAEKYENTSILFACKNLKVQQQAF